MVVMNPTPDDATPSALIGVPCIAQDHTIGVPVQSAGDEGDAHYGAAARMVCTQEMRPYWHCQMEVTAPSAKVT